MQFKRFWGILSGHAAHEQMNRAAKQNEKISNNTGEVRQTSQRLESSVRLAIKRLQEADGGVSR